MSNDSLYEKVGFILADVKNIGQKVDGVMNKVDCVNKKIIKLSETAVKAKDCKSRSREIELKVANLENKLNSPTIQHRKFVSKLRNNLGLIVTIFSLVSILGAGIYKLAHFIVDIEKAIHVSKTETTKSVTALRQEIKRISLPYYRDTVVNSDKYDKLPLIRLKDTKLTSKRISE
jgi:hypothetical protein